MHHLVFLKSPVSFSGKHRNACCYLYFGACELKSFPFIPSQVSFLWMIFALQQCQAEAYTRALRYRAHPQREPVPKHPHTCKWEIMTNPHCLKHSAGVDLP